MHVMVATRRTQGVRPDDYSRTIDGELVFLPMVGCDRGDPISFREGARSFVGLESREETTTAEVLDMDITTEDVIAYIREKMSANGWTDRHAVMIEAKRMADLMLSISALLAQGVVVEKRGSEIRARLAADSGDG